MDNKLKVNLTECKNIVQNCTEHIWMKAMGPVNFIHIWCHLSTSSLRKFSVILIGQGGLQLVQLVETNENYQPFPLELILLSPPHEKVASPSPFFIVWNIFNIKACCIIVLAGLGWLQMKKCFHSNTKFYCQFKSISFGELSQHFCPCL